MRSESNKIDRRQFLALGAVTGAGALVGADSTPATGQTSAAGQAPPAGRSPVVITPIELPEKVFNTADAGISRKTHEEHYELYKGYVARANDIRARLAALTVADQGKTDPVYSEIRELKVEFAFALGGVKSHELFFKHLGGALTEPAGLLEEAINNAFGSFALWKADMRATALASRGWAWLVYNYTDNTMFNYIGDAQNTFAVWNAAPVVGLDVCEHAYYLDFGPDRVKYVDALIDSLDWRSISDSYKVTDSLADTYRRAR